MHDKKSQRRASLAGDLSHHKATRPSLTQTKKSPLPHQKEAIKDNLKVLAQPGRDIRAQTHMACGTGKTLVGLWVSEQLGDRTMLCEPSLALIAQNLKEWRANARGEQADVLVVCSDKSTVGINQDELVVRPEELQAQVTTDPSVVRNFLRDTSRPKLLLSTYHSSPVVSEAMNDRKVPEFSCAVVDEAHRTASVEENNFSLIHYQDAIRSRTRLYLTATPKIFDAGVEDTDRVIASMDNHDTFGVVSHSLSFCKAIEIGLLSDYRLVVTTLTEESISAKSAVNRLSPEMLTQLAVLRAIEKYELSKLISFHSSVSRAYDFANTIGELGAKYLGLGQVWSHGIDGKMPSSVRAGILDALAHNSKGQISIAANCRCLTEGVDLPALDGVVFCDAKKSEVDIVQAIGRVIRKAPGKEIGTVIVPLVVPRDVDSSDYLERKSVFKPIAQVLRALKAHDDRFEIRMRARFTEEAEGEKKKKRGGEFRGGDLEFVGLEASSKEFARILTAKTLRIGSGLNASPLSEEKIVEAAREYYKLYGKLPTGESREPVPGLKGESWIALYMACYKGFRTLTKGRTLSMILAPLRKELGLTNTLTEAAIIEAAREFYKIHGKLPNQASEESVPGMNGESWRQIDAACRLGYRSLTKGRTLIKILEPLKRELGLSSDLSQTAIIAAAREFYKLQGCLPSCSSREQVPGLNGDTWFSIDDAARHGRRSLTQGTSLSKILAPLKIELNLANTLSEDAIIEAAQTFFSIHGKVPNVKTKEPVPGMKGETWRALNAAGAGGYRGLKKGRTLAVILGRVKDDRKQEYLLSEDVIVEAVRKFFTVHGRLPCARSKEPVPTLSRESWSSINTAGARGKRGLTKGRTLAVIIAPLKEELGIAKGLSEALIVSAARKYYEKHGMLPNTKTKDSFLDSGDDTWISINSAIVQGLRGLPKGLSLSTILDPLKDEFGLGNQLEESSIIQAAREFYLLHGKLPSAITKELVPGMEGETWTAINMAGQVGTRSLTKGRTLAVILAPLKKELGLINELTEEAVIQAARLFFITHNRLPSVDSKEPVPGIEGNTWRSINMAGTRGNRSLPKGRTLSKILEPLRKELGS